MNLMFQKQFFSNTVQEYFLFLVLFFVLFIAFRLFKTIFLKKIKEITKNTKNNFDDLFTDIFDGISKLFYWFLSFFIAVKLLTLPNSFDKVLFYIFVLLVVFEIISALKKIIKYFVEFFSERADSGKKSVYRLVGKLSYGIVYLVAFLFVLSAFGINITAIVAGLGIGGIAIALALKEILADLFSYFTILLDKPIEIGDYVTVGEKSGSVKKIGIKTTRLVGPDGREVVVSNTAISSGFIDNSGKRDYRRIKFTLGVAYDTPAEKLKKIKPFIAQLLESEEKGEFLRTHFKNFGDSALEFSIDYKLFTDGYDEYADAKERINFAILDFCEKEQIEIAYPTMTIHQK